MAVWSETTTTEIYRAGRIDSEYFRPEYIDAELAVRKLSHKNLGSLGSFIPGPFGSAFHVKNYNYESEDRYLRGRDVKPFILQNDQNEYLPETDYHRLIKYSLELYDLLISVVGTLGNVAIVGEDTLPSIFSCKSTVFRTFNTNPYF